MLLDKHHPFYMAWCNMKTRCNNPNSTQYKWYGARGITVDPSWNSFEQFFVDMFPTWELGLTLDRKDNNKNYCKDNCRWATQQEQNNNRRARSLQQYCNKGHELTDDNCIFYSNGQRTCKTCRRVYFLENKEKRNEQRRIRRANGATG